MPSLYEITIPPFISSLKILSSLLEKGLAHTEGNEVTLIESRLIEDMYSLPYQIQRVSDTAKGLAVRVAKTEPVSWEDNEKTFAELQERLAKTITYLEAIDPKSFEGKENEEVLLPQRSGALSFTGTNYATQYAIPNFYFHFVTAYALLRKEGVPIGKADYLGRK